MSSNCSSFASCDFVGLVGAFVGLLTLVIPLIFGLTFLVIAWKITDAWILHGGEADKIEEGKKTALIGVIVLVVMSGIWGILAILRSSLG